MPVEIQSKWFNSTKGFGFIQPDNGGADEFVHISRGRARGPQQSHRGPEVAYDERQDPKRGKTSAENLKSA